MARYLVFMPGIYEVLGFHRVVVCYFWYDDFYWLFRWLHAPPLAFLTEGAPGHLLPVRNLVVAATAAAFGFEPTRWFATVLAAHVATAVVLAMVLERATGARLLSAAVAAAWAIAPLHGGTLSWYSAATHSWSTLALGAFLLALPMTGRPHRLGAALALVAAAMTFGTGLAAVLGSPVIAAVLRPGDRRTIGVCSGVALFCLAAYLALGSGSHNVIADPAINRATTALGAVDHPLAAVRLGGALAWIGATDLAGNGVGAPAIALLAAIGLAHPASRRMTTVGLLIAGASYGAIAIGRAGVVAVLGVPLWKVAASGHYHYAGQFGLALAVGAALAAALAAQRDRAAALVLLLTTLRLVLAPTPIDTHDDARQAMRRLEREAAAAAAAGRHLKNAPFAPALTMILFATPDRFPGRAAAFTLLRPDGTIEGQPVRFTAQTWDEYRAVRDGGPIARVLAPPATGPESK